MRRSRRSKDKRFFGTYSTWSPETGYSHLPVWAEGGGAFWQLITAQQLANDDGRRRKSTLKIFLLFLLSKLRPSNNLSKSKFECPDCSHRRHPVQVGVFVRRISAWSAWCIYRAEKQPPLFTPSRRAVRSGGRNEQPTVWVWRNWQTHTQPS